MQRLAALKNIRKQVTGYLKHHNFYSIIIFFTVTFTPSPFIIFKK
jgi:hypothetical protein